MTPTTDERRGQTLVIVDKLWADQHRVAVERFLVDHWGAIRQRHPDARLIVIGGKGMPEHFSNYVRGLPGCELHERVDRLEDVLATAGIAVFPYSVEVGMKTRVLQCMASMNAVVATPNGFLGLPVQNGVDAIIADDHAAIASAVDSLLAEPARAVTMGEKARTFIASRFTESHVGQAWEALYRDVASGAPVQESYGVLDAGAAA